MIDDTRQLQYGGPGPTMPRAALRVSDHVPKILEHPVARLHANQWARSLRFLTFDDIEEVASEENSRLIPVAGPGQHPESTQPLRGQCQPCERREPLPSGHMCAGHRVSEDAAKKREAELLKYSDPCVHVNENSCHFCQHIPLFPNRGKLTRFRIRRVFPPDFKGSAHCDHFVAVSYCWSSENNTESEPYKVVEEDGTVRNVRAQNSTIDRVVAYARENGFRMIWIDQECIDQDHPKEKELAIQSMDLVYLRARRSIGLLQTQLQQKHLECLSMVYESHIMPRSRPRRGKSAFTRCHKVELETMRETVSMVVNDKWNTRAWVLQEAFASSGNMLLLFPKADKVDLRGWMMICHEASRSELAIRLDTIQSCIAVCGRMIQPLLSRALNTDTGKNNRPGRQRRKARGKKQKDPDPEEIRVTMQRIRFFHPSAPNSGGSFWANGSKNKRTCSAAVALTYLRLRDLERVADKLAIVANLCGYRLRLNTVELDETQPSLAVCTLVLAIANGDFSLLIPQIYHLPQSKVLEFPLASGDQSDFSWAHSFTQCLQDVEAENWNPYGPMSGASVATFVDLTPRGLSFPGSMWRLDEFVDLKQIKAKYAASWLRMRRAQGPSRPSGRTIELATTHILFEILETLKTRGEKQVANSILNSTSNWRWRNHGAFFTDVLESVDDFPSGLRIENRKGLFDLDRSPDGWFHQCWIIDRVMETGGFWTGTLEEHESLLHDQPRDPERITDLSSHKSKAPETTPQIQERGLVLGSSMGNEQRHKKKHRGHARRLVQSFMLSMAVGEVEGIAHDEAEDLGAPPDDHQAAVMKHVFTAPQAMSSLALMCYDMTEQDSGRHHHKRRAVFDVTGNAGNTVQVLTPFNPVLESIPRPAMRSMAISWIVEDVGDAAGEDGLGRRIRVTGMANGMWEFDTTITGRYNVI